MITTQFQGIAGLEGFVDTVTDWFSDTTAGQAAGTIADAWRGTPTTTVTPAVTGISKAATPVVSTRAARNPSGPALADRQRQLQRLGYNVGPVDGLDGPQTQNAIRAFQASKGLTVDGVIGPQTGTALDRAVAALGGGPVASATPAQPVASTTPLAPLPAPTTPGAPTTAAPSWMLYGVGALAVGGAAYMLTKKGKRGRRARRA